MAKEEVNKFINVTKPMLVIDNIGYPVLKFHGKQVSGRSTPQAKQDILDELKELGPGVYDKTIEELVKKQKEMLLDHLKDVVAGIKKEPQQVLNNALRGAAPEMFTMQLAYEIGLFFIFMDNRTALNIEEVIQKSVNQKANCIQVVEEIIRYLEKGCVVDMAVKINQ